MSGDNVSVCVWINPLADPHASGRTLGIANLLIGVAFDSHTAISVISLSWPPPSNDN